MLKKGNIEMNLLKKYRLLKGITQQELAFKSGYSLRSIHNFEKCDLNELRIDTIITLCEALNVDKIKFILELWGVTNEKR